jgi:hypothetical protein
MRHSRRKSTQRRLAAIEEVRGLLLAIAEGSCDLLLSYRRVCRIYADTSGAVEELKPFLHLPGIYADNISLNEEVRRTITDAAIQWLKENSN